MPRALYITQGLRICIEFTRMNANLELFFAEIRAAKLALIRC
jgi:hypothetical protein